MIRVFIEECSCELAELDPLDIAQEYICFEGDKVEVVGEKDENILFHFILNYDPEPGTGIHHRSRPMVMAKYAFNAVTLTKREYDRKFLEGLLDG